MFRLRLMICGTNASTSLECAPPSPRKNAKTRNSCLYAHYKGPNKVMLCWCCWEHARSLLMSLSANNACTDPQVAHTQAHLIWWFMMCTRVCVDVLDGRCVCGRLPPLCSQKYARSSKSRTRENPPSLFVTLTRRSCPLDRVENDLILLVRNAHFIWNIFS